MTKHAYFYVSPIDMISHFWYEHRTSTYIDINMNTNFNFECNQPLFKYFDYYLPPDMECKAIFLYRLLFLQVLAARLACYCKLLLMPVLWYKFRFRFPLHNEIIGFFGVSIDEITHFYIRFSYAYLGFYEFIAGGS